MERLTLRTGKRGATHDFDDGYNENEFGQRERQGRSPRGDGLREQEGRTRTQRQGNSQGEKEKAGRGGAELEWRARGGGERGGIAVWPEARRGANTPTWRERDAYQQRGRSRRDVAERQKFGVGRLLAGNEREGARRGGQSGDRRESLGSQDRKMGYKNLEDLSKDDASVVAIVLSTKPGFHALLGDTNMRQDLIQLICMVLKKAFTSKTDVSTLQHLACIVKNSKFFQITLLHYVGGMVSEPSASRRIQYPQCLENILAILSEVNEGKNA